MRNWAFKIGRAVTFIGLAMGLAMGYETAGAAAIILLFIFYEIIVNSIFKSDGGCKWDK